MDLLTPSVNVPAERAKLRRLRDEIAADVQAREELTRLHGVRGFRRLRDVSALATEEVRRDGNASALRLRYGAKVEVSASAGDVSKAQGRCSGCGQCACEVDREGWAD